MVGFGSFGCRVGCPNLLARVYSLFCDTVMYRNEHHRRIIGDTFYLVVYGVLGYVTAKHVTAWKQCALLILLQTVLVFATALGSWMLDTMQLFRPWALLYVKEPVRTLLHKNDLGSFAIHYGLAWAETVILPLLAVGVNKVLRKIREKSTASPQKQ